MSAPLKNVARQSRRFVILSLTVIALTRMPLVAQGLKLVGAVVQALNDANDTVDRLTRLQTALSDFQQGKRPNTSGDWAQLGEHFQLAASRLRAAPLPDLNISQTPLIYPKLSCKSDLVSRSQNYLDRLVATQADGNQAVNTLNDQIVLVDKAKSVMEQIRKLYEKLSAVPNFGSYFALDWVDLETTVPEGLSDYASAVKERRDAVNKQMDQLSTRINNLRSNIALMHRPCDEDAREQKRREEQAQAALEAQQQAQRDAQEKAQREAQEKAQERARQAAQMIPWGWVKCTCPQQHASQGMWVLGTLYHPPTLKCAP